MKKLGLFLLGLFLVFPCGFIFSQDVSTSSVTSAVAPAEIAQPASVSIPVVAATKLVLLISEQNIEGPQKAWWASEIDLSTIEAAIAGKLLEQGYEILEPQALSEVIQKDKAFRVVKLSDKNSVKLGNFANANYVIVGKAVASAGGKVIQSNMLSCFANVSAKIIRVSDNKIIAYIDAAGNSAHLDVVSGGREALAKAGDILAQKIVAALSKNGGK